MPHYQTSASMNYMPNNQQVQFAPVTSTYPSYSPTYLQHPSTSQAAIHWPTTTSTMSYSLRPPPRSATLPSQHRISSRPTYFSSPSQSSRLPHLHLRTPLQMDFVIMDTEDQDSVNRETMKSEPIEPPLQGYPKVQDFDDLMKNYVAQLSPKKQDKALIHAARASNIRTVLIDKRTTSIESAQFRFWVKKMFQLQPSDQSAPVNRRKICHEGKPVAIREKLFKILTRAHQKCQHGGRDKTSAQVRRVYSWVPKELISRFVKLCPTCQIRRGMSRASEDDDKDNADDFGDTETVDGVESPVMSRRQSTMDRSQDSSMIEMPMQLVNGSTTFQAQNRWLDGYNPPHSAYDNLYSPTSHAASSSFSAINGYEPTTTSHVAHHPLQTMTDLSPTHSRPVSGHGRTYKQEAQYCYD